MADPRVTVDEIETALVAAAVVRVGGVLDSEGKLKEDFKSVKEGVESATFTEEEVRDQAISVAAQMLYPFVNEDEFAGQRIREAARAMIAQLRLEKQKAEEERADAGAE